MTRQEIEKVKRCSESAGEAWSLWRRFEDEMIKKSPIRRMAKRLCLSSEDMTLVEVAVRDEYREMGSRKNRGPFRLSLTRTVSCPR
jgi:recombinational DNA repair protein RecT